MEEKRDGSGKPSKEKQYLGQYLKMSSQEGGEGRMIWAERVTRASTSSVRVYGTLGAMSSFAWPEDILR